MSGLSDIKSALEKMNLGLSNAQLNQLAQFILQAQTGNQGSESGGKGSGSGCGGGGSGGSAGCGSSGGSSSASTGSVNDLIAQLKALFPDLDEEKLMELAQLVQGYMPQQQNTKAVS